MLRVVANAVNELIRLELKSANFMDGGEKWELVFHVLGFQHVIDFFCGDWTLKVIHYPACEYSNMYI